MESVSTDDVHEEEGGEPTGDVGIRRYPVRRRPKYLNFMATGMILGILAGGVWTFIGPQAADYSYTSVLGYTCLVLGFIGAMAGGLLAMVLDRKR